MSSKDGGGNDGDDDDDGVDDGYDDDKNNNKIMRVDYMSDAILNSTGQSLALGSTW